MTYTTGIFKAKSRSQGFGLEEVVLGDVEDLTLISRRVGNIVRKVGNDLNHDKSVNQHWCFR